MTAANMNDTMSNHSTQYNRLQDPVEPFTIWCKRRLKNPCFLLTIIGLVGGLVALVVLHPWEGAPKHQYTLTEQENYYGHQQFLYDPYLLLFTGFVRLNNSETVDVGMQMRFEPYLMEDLTVFHCPGEPYTKAVSNKSHEILKLTNAKNKSDCLTTFVDQFIASIAKLLPLPIPGLEDIIEQLLDGIVKMTVHEDLVFDRYNNSVNVHFDVMNLIQVNVKCLGNGVTPSPTYAPTLVPTVPTPKPTPTPTATPTPQPTPTPTQPGETAAPTTLVPTAAPTTAAPTKKVEHPAGSYEGTKSMFGHTIDSKLTFLDASSVDLFLTVSGTSANVTCLNEPYTTSTQGALNLTSTPVVGDCLHDAMAANNLVVDAIQWDQTTDKVTLSATYEGMISMDLDMDHL